MLPNEFLHLGTDYSMNIHIVVYHFDYNLLGHYTFILDVNTAKQLYSFISQLNMENDQVKSVVGRDQKTC